MERTRVTAIARRSVAVLALAAALAGTAIAGSDATTSPLTKPKVKKIATKQINKLASGLSVANATALGGQPASAFASSTSEPYHEIGAPGEPGFQNGWANFGSGLSTAAFYKDPLGVVHLKGVISNASDSTVAFTLPLGYRPSQILLPAVQETSLGAAGISINPNGDVIVQCAGGGTCNTGIDGITFRAV